MFNCIALLLNDKCFSLSVVYFLFFFLKIENIVQAYFIRMSSISLWFTPKPHRCRDASACSLPALAGTSGWGGSLVCGLSLRSRLASFGSRDFISAVCMGVTDRRFWSEICSLLERYLLWRPQMLSVASGLSLINFMSTNKLL